MRIAEKQSKEHRQHVQVDRLDNHSHQYLHRERESLADIAESKLQRWSPLYIVEAS